MENKEIHVAADTNVLIMLSILHKHGQKVLKVLEGNNYHSSEVKDLVLANKNMAKNFIYTQTPTINYCHNLEVTAKLYNLIKDKKIKVYVLPAVAGELQLTNPNSSNTPYFISLFKSLDNIIVLRVNEEDKHQFYLNSMLLAKKYVERHHMTSVYSAAAQSFVPSNDAWIAAESSLFGLTFLTFNEKDFIHQDWHDYKKTNGIRSVNMLNKLRVFKSNIGKKMVAQPMGVTSFLDNLEKLGINSEKFVLTYPNIDKDTGNLIAASLRDE